VFLELEALKTPEGVEETLFAQLKQALTLALAERAGGTRSSGPYRYTYSPPIGAGSVVSDLAVVEENGDYRLVWSYRNPGDYNQDGTAKIDDLTVLAVHFGHGMDADGNWPDPLDEVVDGNGDGVVDIKDVTPLAANFFGTVAGYAVRAADSDAGPFEVIGDVDLADAETDGCLRFSLLLNDSTLSYAFYLVVPRDGAGQEGSPSEVAGGVELLSLPGDWSMEGGNAQQQRRSSYAGPETAVALWHRWSPGGVY